MGSVCFRIARTALRERWNTCTALYEGPYKLFSSVGVYIVPDRLHHQVKSIPLSKWTYFDWLFYMIAMSAGEMPVVYAAP